MILHQVEDYRILGTIARAEQVPGATADAIRHYEQALHHCPETDFSEKAATLSNMAGVVAQQGDIERALQLWQESLEIQERIGDVQGKAATLANMAWIAGEQGDRIRQFELNGPAAQALAQVKAYGDLFTVLSNLGATAPDHSDAYLAQALWLGIRIQTSLSDLINLLRFFYNRVPQGDGMEPLLAATALFVCQVRGAGHPQLNDLQHTSLQMVDNAAVSQGVEVDSPETLTHWMAAQQLNDPQVFLPRLNQQLVAMIGNHWLFDPTGFSSNPLQISN
ncbi:tetratricopeptide repeat protein [Leptothermofonsia sichuanensis]|uniref:tetratricopeptide repeat protein n=1 Tax=Leptothermofonsia sichuanensis TaxID=2917832 RepID=UPI0028F452FC|nr:tetratricopeptide repeat protein [Leptothermofonsia sichuanensis]